MSSGRDSQQTCLGPQLGFHWWCASKLADRCGEVRRAFFQVDVTIDRKSVGLGGIQHRELERVLERMFAR
jgi:hypothetical protein